MTNQGEDPRQRKEGKGEKQEALAGSAKGAELVLYFVYSKPSSSLTGNESRFPVPKHPSQVVVVESRRWYIKHP